MLINISPADMAAVGHLTRDHSDVGTLLLLTGELAENWSGYDPWGELMGFTFALCDWASDYLGDVVPDELGFRQSPFGSDEEDYTYRGLVELHKEYTLTENGVRLALEHIAVALDGYKLAGLDY